MIHSGCILKLGVIGLNHKTADLSLREAMAKGASGFAGEKALFFPYPIVLLSTCNRTEIYFSSDDLAETHIEILSFLRRQIEIPFEHRLYSYFGLDCFVHLSRVTSGIDSAIFAETEIQRQVKVTYERARQDRSLPPCLHFAFQKALKVGKAIRTQFETRSPSLPATIWEIIQDHFDDLSSIKTLFIGYSDINRTLIDFVQKKGLSSVALSTRDPASCRPLNYQVFDRSVLKRWLDFDLIISASKSDDYLVQGSSTRSHLLFDLSVPRNVDPLVAREENIQLFNIEQLNARIEQKQLSQGANLELCEELIWDRAITLARRYRESRLRLSHLVTSVG